MDQKTEIIPTTPTPYPVRPRPWLAIPLIALALTIIGLLIYQNYQLKKQLTTSEAPQSQSSFIPPDPVAKADDSTSGWKTYSNLQYGFSFKYPDNLEVKRDADYYIFLNPLTPDAPPFPFPDYEKGLPYRKTQFTTTLITYNPEMFQGEMPYKNAKEFFDKDYNLPNGYTRPSQGGYDYPLKKLKNFIVAGQRAMMFEGPGVIVDGHLPTMERTVRILKSDNLAIDIRSIVFQTCSYQCELDASYDHKEADRLFNQLDQILSTFKFLE